METKSTIINPVNGSVIKVMHLIATNFFGGPEKQIVEHLKRLEMEKYCGIVTSFIEYRKENETLQEAERAGLKFFGIPMNGPIDISAQWKLTQLVHKEKVALLCVHGYKACVMGLWAGRRNKIPVIAFSRGYTTENVKIKFYNWLERIALRNMDGIIAVSEGQLNKLEGLGISNYNSRVVHNAGKINNLSKEKMLFKNR